MKTIEELQAEIIAEFSEVDDWMDRYAMIIDMAADLPPMDDSLKTPDRLIDGCQSRVWIDAQRSPDGSLHFSADSDALIVKGIIAMLLDVLNDHSPEEIAAADLHFINDIGLAENLSPTRSNGLVAMLRRIKAFAVAYSAAR